MSAQIPRPIGTMAFASALLVSGLAVGVPANSAFAVDCLTAPNSSAPPNSHWYYRTDRTQQRKCWYLRDDNEVSEHRAVPTASEAQTTKPSQSVSAAGSYSFASFKDFMVKHEGAKLSDQEVKKLYVEFLEWNRGAKN
jgi:hypothetical protein